MATYIGWLLHRTVFVLPRVIAIMGLSWVYAILGDAGPVQAFFFGLKAAVLAIVFEAVIRIGKRFIGKCREKGMTNSQCPVSLPTGPHQISRYVIRTRFA